MHWDFALILLFFAIAVPFLGRRRIRQLLAVPETTKRQRLRLYASTIAFQWIAVAIIFGCAFYVSQQYQHATEYCQEKATKGRPSPHKENPDKCAEDAEKHFPSWYRLFSWPEGIGTWAILLTLLVISEQTNQTRRSAEVSELQAKVWREAIVI